jgi:hypothetical protein
LVNVMPLDEFLEQNTYKKTNLELPQI